MKGFLFFNPLQLLNPLIYFFLFFSFLQIDSIQNKSLLNLNHYNFGAVEDGKKVSQYNSRP